MQNHNSNKDNKSSNKDSKSKLIGLDTARLLAMLMMMQGHTIYALLDKGVIESGMWYWNIWTFIRGLTAPVFLMVSGAVHIFANKRDENGILPNATIKRRIRICFILFIVGYLLQFPANNIYDLIFITQDEFYSFLKVNILQMFAATLILLNILFKLTTNNKQLAIISFTVGNLILISSHFVLSVNWYDILPMPLAAYFSIQHKTIFPLFPFSAYLFIGTYIGYLLQQRTAEKRNEFLIKNLALFGLFYVVLGYIVNYWYAGYGGYKIIGPSFITPGLIIARAGLAMIAISIASLFSTYILKLSDTVVPNSNTELKKDDTELKLSDAKLKLYDTRLKTSDIKLKTSDSELKISDIISKFSRRSLFIYVIHLLIIYGSPVTPGIRHLFFNVDVFTAFYCAFFVVIFSLFIVYIYDITIRYEKIRQLYKYLIIALIIFMLLI